MKDPHHELFGIERSIIQGGMHLGFAAATVANAGTLGLIIVAPIPNAEPHDFLRPSLKC